MAMMASATVHNSKVMPGERISCTANHGSVAHHGPTLDQRDKYSLKEASSRSRERLEEELAPLFSGKKRGMMGNSIMNSASQSQRMTQSPRMEENKAPTDSAPSSPILTLNLKKRRKMRQFQNFINEIPSKDMASSSSGKNSNTSLD